MAFSTKLWSVLDNLDEPLPKRLRIAKNAFISTELPAVNKESILLRWLSKAVTENDTPEVWNTLYSCLSLGGFNEFRPVQHEALKETLTTIQSCLSEEPSSDLKQAIMQCAGAVLKSYVFWLYFKHDAKSYCIFVSTYLDNINDLSELDESVWSCLFGRNILRDEYYEHFLTYTLNSVISFLNRFHNPALYRNCTRITKTALLEYISTDLMDIISSVLDSEQPDQNLLSANIVIKKLEEIYSNTPDSNFVKIGFRLIIEIIFDICKRKKNFLPVYKFLLVILNIIGFKTEKHFSINLYENETRTDRSFNLDKSLQILAEFFELMNINNAIIFDKIKDVSFSDCISFLMSSVVKMHTRPCLQIFKIVKNLIVIDPIIIDGLIGNILTIMVRTKKSEAAQLLYTDAIVGLSEMYFKQHRIHHFLRQILNVLKGDGSVENSEAEETFEFMGKKKCKLEKLGPITTVEEIFPKSVISYFQNCIVQMSHEQVLQIIKTLTNGLDEIADDLQICASDPKRTLYVQVISEITCQCLSAMKIAGQATTEMNVKRILKKMEKLREILTKFGTQLLKMEHNHTLMFSFLNICYIWAEVGILLTYYEPADDIVNFKGSPTNDKSVSNITYLHSYLTAKQWSLISQRIKNFGEQPCKYILQKLIIQKLRAELLFEPEVNTAVKSTVVSSFASNLEVSWDLIWEERFIASTFLPKMETAQLLVLADFLISDIIKNNRFTTFRQATMTDSRSLITAVLYCCLSKINSLFKKKRKHNEETSVRFISCKIFKSIDADLFVKTDRVDLQKLAAFIRNEDNEQMNLPNLNIDFEKFNSYLEVLKNIPVYSFSDEVQSAFFLYLLSLCMDLNRFNSSDAKMLEKCEEYLIGLAEFDSSSNIFSYISSDILLTTIAKNVKRYKDLLSLMLPKVFKTCNIFEPAIKMLTQNSADNKDIKLSVFVLQQIHEAMKGKIPKRMRQHLHSFKEELSKDLLPFVKDKEINELSLEAFTLILEISLSSDKKEEFITIKPRLKPYIDYTVNNVTESNATVCFQFFYVILRYFNPQRLSLPGNFATSLWNLCSDLTMSEKFQNELEKVMPLILKNVPYNDFKCIMEKDFNSTMNLCRAEEIDAVDLKKKITLWNYYQSHFRLENSYFSSDEFLKYLIPLLENIYLAVSKKQELLDTFLKLQLNIIRNKMITQSYRFIDIYLQTAQIYMSKDFTHASFPPAFDLSVEILYSLGSFRGTLITDRIPSYLMVTRILLKKLFAYSNTNQDLERSIVLQLSNCALRIQKLMRVITAWQKDMQRLAPYLIADILKLYEKFNVYPEVKNHITNCLYQLINICDEHGIAFLMRGLSQASTELFKYNYENYKKYYKFTTKI